MNILTLLQLNNEQPKPTTNKNTVRNGCVFYYILKKLMKYDISVILMYIKGKGENEMSLIQIFAFPDYAIAVSDGRTSIPLINENGQRIENRFSDIEHENFTKMRIYNKMLFFSTGATHFGYRKDTSDERSYTFIEILEDLNAHNNLNHSPSDIMDYLCNNFQPIGSDSQIGILYLNKETNFFEIVHRSPKHENNNPIILDDYYCNNYSNDYAINIANGIKFEASRNQFIQDQIKDCVNFFYLVKEKTKEHFGDIHPIGDVANILVIKKI